MNAPLQHNAAAALREHIEELEETVRQLREQLIPSVTFPAEIGLTATENRMLSFLLARSPNIMPKERIHEAIYFDDDDAPFSKVLDVMLIRCRRKLAPYGVAIVSAWAAGLCIEKQSADILRAMLRGDIRRLDEPAKAARPALAALPAPEPAQPPPDNAPSALQIRTVKAFASAGHAAAFIAKQVDLPLPVVKSILKGD
jgi:hypothetical protein